MSARDEFRNHAKLFDWTMSNQWDHDIFYRGDQCIQVNYRRDDAVERAARFWFVRVDDYRQRSEREIHLDIRLPGHVGTVICRRRRSVAPKLFVQLTEPRVSLTT